MQPLQRDYKEARVKEEQYKLAPRPTVKDHAIDSNNRSYRSAR